MIPREINDGPNTYLWSLSIIAAGGGLLFGYDAVVMSGAIPIVIEQFRFSPFALGFLVSCVLWGCAIGSAAGGPLLTRFGRKQILFLSALIIFVSAIWSSLASGPLQLDIARLSGGIGGGLATSACPLYISEISTEDRRGSMVSLYHLAVCLGIVICVFVNWGVYSYAASHAAVASSGTFRLLFVDQYWRAMFLSEAVPAMLFLLGTMIIPESPRYLMIEGSERSALDVLERLEGKLRAGEILEEIRSSIGRKRQSSYRELFSGPLRRAMRLSLILCILSEACGITAVLYYGPQLLEQSGFSLGRSLGGFTIIAIVNMLFNFIAIRYMDTLGRKKLLSIGSAGCMLSLIAVGTLFMIGQTGLLIVFPIITFTSFFAFSVGPIKFVIISEVFPARIRGKAVSLSTMSIWVTSAIITQLFPVLREILPTGMIFYLFALDLAVLLIIAVRFLPETGGKTLEQINEYWLEGNRPDSLSQGVL